LTQYVPIVKGLLAKHFEVVSDITYRLDEDSEIGQTYLLFEFGVRGDVDRVLNAYNGFTDEWLKVAPDHVTERVRISFDVVS
jgi:hypothetical protein